MWEGPGIQFRVAQHLLKLGVLQGAVDGGVGVVLRWGGGLVGLVGGHERGHEVGREGTLYGKGVWAALLQGGAVGEPWGQCGVRRGPWGEPWGPLLSHDVAGHVGRIAAGGYPRL